MDLCSNAVCCLCSIISLLPPLSPKPLTLNHKHHPTSNIPPNSLSLCVHLLHTRRQRRQGKQPIAHERVTTTTSNTIRLLHRPFTCR